MLAPLALAACLTPGASSPRRQNFDPDLAKLRKSDALLVTVPPKEPAVRRGKGYAGFVEEFNRYYTEPGYTPPKTIYVSPEGSGNGTSPKSAMSVKAGLFAAKPGTRVFFVRGQYQGCYGFDGDVGGTIDEPIVLYAERNPDGSRGVKMQCCGHNRASCFNFEATSYVAVDGFELRGGKYGVRAVGADYAATQHSRGIMVTNSYIYDQSHDGVLTGAADWTVFENNVVATSGEGDGHGIYLSNGSDYAIVRNNDLHGNEGATFQINADPLSTCDNAAGDACDGIAGTGDGGRGASDFMLVENNYFHHGTAQGPNFTSVRYSVVRNNVFASWGRHGVSFWSETADPKEKKMYNPNLGSHHNRVHHNLFVATNDRHMLQFINNSNDCDVRNNLFVGMTVNGSAIVARPSAVWMETDASVDRNVYANNVYIAGKFDGRARTAPTEKSRQDLDVGWFTKLPTGMPSTVADWKPRPNAPFLNQAPRLDTVTLDRDGNPRKDPVDPGPFELP